MSDFFTKVCQLLNEIESELATAGLLKALPSEITAFESVEPFCIDTMSGEEWLQWVFLPRMHALLDKNQSDASHSLPRNFSMYPYFEEVFKEAKYFELLKKIKAFDLLMKDV